MTKSIEFFFSYQSPYSYLALDSLYEIQDNYEVEVLWQPFSAKASGQQMPTTGIIPDKLTYLFEDTARFAAEFAVPLTFSENWPENEFDPSRVTRGALIANDLGVLKEYNYKVFDKWWGQGQNPNEENFMTELCEEIDIDLGDFLSKISSSDTRERVKGVYNRGRKLGVYDTPTILVDGKERLVGIDKIPYLTKRLEAAGLRKAKR